MCTLINPTTGIITSDAINVSHERFSKHPDTGKTFKGFQYPAWQKVRSIVVEMAKMIPNLRHIGWDIAITDKSEVLLVEANGLHPDEELQQAPDDTGRLYLYKPLIDELKRYKAVQMKSLGYRVNNLHDFYSIYKINPLRDNLRLKIAMDKLMPDCKSLMDVGCRDKKFVKSICPENVKYYPVDYEKHDDEVIACNFSNGEFPKMKADTVLCAFTAEYVEALPKFLGNMCNAAQKQILMWCSPVDIEDNAGVCRLYSWENPFLTDFTEEFLINTMTINHFQLSRKYFIADNKTVVLYDFRKI